MISIIIPAYNASRHLAQCVGSCLAQTYKDIELLIVNDASTDSTQAVCDACARRDKRVRIINKTVNEGVDKARFIGLENASPASDYVFFIDSDDWLSHSGVLVSMFKKAEETNADYVEIGMQRVMDRHGLIKRDCLCAVTGQITAPELFDKYYLSFFGVNILSVNMAGKLYRKSVLDKAQLKPTGLKMGEDLAFNMQLFPFLKNIYIINDTGYCYRFGGMTSRYNPDLLPDLKRLYRIKEELIKRYRYEKASDYIRIELKNVLKSDICQMIRFGVYPEDGIVSRIKTELKDPVYKRMAQIKSATAFLREPFTQAIINEDAELAYAICKEQARHERPKIWLKRIASFLFTHI